ncbi:cellulose-binding GDSL lipase/acylhydrolase [Diaporthe helianthi]|uniref:Cellulose-binding GDSL lipase/acylhydrolase n=1 Tax=Diaporthe helianthi TaxID=158607 RepID=A0A2P5HZ78_DIAHE|nr:cellulose-binding GDSL lipase/acylhydrolase [Diaporthe helianthi]
MALRSFWVVSLLATAASAQVPMYGQCGGIGFTGATNCASGLVCTSFNAYYSQCLQGTSSTVTTLSTSKAPTPTTTFKTSTTSTATPSSAPIGTKYLITFGDSYSQTGFDINGNKPSASNPIGNPALPGYTAAGGLNWVGMLASQLNTSTLLTYNFAYGGATTDSNLVKPYDPSVKSFVDQVGQFSSSLASHPSYAPWTAANTLVGVWIGVNDVGNSYYLSNVDEVIPSVIAKYFQLLQIIYDAGARNFVLLSVPPIQYTPLMLGQEQSARDLEATVIAKYNQLVVSSLANFTAANTGVTAKIVDTTKPFMTAVENPTAYGSPDATCYNADGKSCLWFNDYHPGYSINKLVAQAVVSAWKGSFF